MIEHRTLGVTDERGHPKKPMYELGPLITRGANFFEQEWPNGERTELNHSDCVLPCG